MDKWGLSGTRDRERNCHHSSACLNQQLTVMCYVIITASLATTQLEQRRNLEYDARVDGSTSNTLYGLTTESRTWTIATAVHIHGYWHTAEEMKMTVFEFFNSSWIGLTRFGSG